MHINMVGCCRYKCLYVSIHKNKNYLLVEENRELKQVSEKSIMEFGAQVHSLEMASLDKDAHIEKYQAKIRQQEGECALLT